MSSQIYTSNDATCKDCIHMNRCTLVLKFKNVEYSYKENKFVNLCNRYIKK